MSTGDAIVMGGSSGLGKAIAESLAAIGYNVTPTSRKDIDTSDLQSVKRFALSHKETDILVLNTGGPPPKTFDNVTIDEWQKFHNQLFLGMCVALRHIHVRDSGYIFMISSSVITEPASNLVVSGAYRSAMTSVLKVLSKELAPRQVSVINIAPGPMNTGRLKELVSNVEKFAKDLPMGRVGNPAELGGLVRGIVENGVKYLSGQSILFDGGNSAAV